MSANLDRFSDGVTPSVPDEVGDCAGCGGVIYDYEVTTCPACGESIHQGCQEHCEFCGFKGCKSCLAQDKDTLDYYCENCNDPATKAAAKCRRTGSHYHLQQYLRKRGA